MSIENAFNDLTAAIKELTAAHLSGAKLTAEANNKLAEAYRESVGAYGTALEEYAGEQNPRVAGAKGTTAEEAADNQAAIEAEHELEQAVAKVEADAKKPATSAAKESPAATAGSASEAESTLDYEKDVKPVLMKVAAKLGKETLVKLLAGRKGPALTADDLVSVLASANELLAA